MVISAENVRSILSLLSQVCFVCCVYMIARSALQYLYKARIVFISRGRQHKGTAADLTAMPVF